MELTCSLNLRCGTFKCRNFVRYFATLQGHDSKYDVSRLNDLVGIFISLVAYYSVIELITMYQLKKTALFNN